ncbi:cob(I)yrinic acid a,c-diamide adenosyltransferase [Leptospira neocaledonica]|uniref:corrinoid adenosyltransferase n=1 Tax=Leptospira neocaledonica TaxID=2023192 RepID=A0A2N0A447_9LEPT|nr:cob(I)yrinic acid a,c-diamide adenosyltransferase [Leptospira neocaledonica]PJZ79089.1 cob(I)yrinic acid a,c-diamide adenosyltransferase [Leptospira neocaledonica]
MNSSPDKKGLILVFTGPGKGKTTAALGILFRALGRGMKCGVVQFLKGKWETGERKFAKTITDLDFHVMGLGFTWESDDIDQDKKAARLAWEKSYEMIFSENYKILILDEITYAFHYGWLSPEEVCDALSKKPGDLHIIITGRNCPSLLTDMADLISQIESPKHPYKKGVPAQIGIDY